MKINNGERSIATGMMAGVVTSVLIMIVMTSITTTLILSGKVEEGFVSTLVILSIMFAMYIATFVTLRKRHSGYALSIGLLVICFVIMCAALNIIAFDANFHKPWIQLIAMIVGTGLALITKIKLTGKTRGKYRYR